MLQPFVFLKNYIKQVNQQGGPVEEDYFQLDRWLRNAYHYGPSPQECQEIFEDVLDKNSTSLFNRIFFTPGGHPGSFDIMQSLYTNTVDTTLSQKLQRWDQFILTQVSSVAVRNRWYMIKHLCEDTYLWKSFLDVACGSGVAFQALQTHHPTRHFHYVGIDQDEQAIAYCQAYHSMQEKNAQFKHIPFLSMTPETLGMSDLVWCSGFFDYISTRKGFMGAARRLIDLSKKFVIIGNMGPYNPSKPFMDMMNWKIHYRTKDELECIGHELHKKYQAITHTHVVTDDTGIQHYLCILLR